MSEPTSALDAGTEADLVDVMERVVCRPDDRHDCSPTPDAAALRSSTHAAARPDRRPSLRLRRRSTLRWVRALL